jgi:hypothetical protein
MAVNDILNLEHAMTELARIRPVFHSEADFKFALAIHLHSLYPELKIGLETPQSQGIALDMLITEPSSGDRFAIELKYKTALWSGEVAGEEFRLKNHGADDIGGYDIIKDVARIESLVGDGSANSGAVIVLTNEPLYWRVRQENSKITNAHEFRVHEGLTLLGVRSWGPNTGGSSKGRESPISLSRAYPITWQDYSEIGGSRGSFRQLIFKVGTIG